MSSSLQNLMCPSSAEEAVEVMFRTNPRKYWRQYINILENEIESLEKQLTEKDAMINWLAERCRCFESDYHVEHKQGLFVGTDWYKAAEEAVKKDE